MRTSLLLAGLLAIGAPALAAPATAPEVVKDAVKSDITPQPTTANDPAVTNGTNVQTVPAGQPEDAPPSGPQKQGGVAAPADPGPAAKER